MITSLPLAPLRFLSIRRTSVFEIPFFYRFSRIYIIVKATEAKYVLMKSNESKLKYNCLYQ